MGVGKCIVEIFVLLSKGWRSEVAVVVGTLCKRGTLIRNTRAYVHNHLTCVMDPNIANLSTGN